MMEIPVNVYTGNPRYVFELIRDSKLSAHRHWEWPVAQGLTVRYAQDKIRMDASHTQTIQLILVISTDIAANVIAGLITAWLLKKFDKEEAKVTKLEIDRDIVEFDENKIKKIIHEKISKTGQ